MAIRVEWWTLTLLLAVTVNTDDSYSCPCVPIEDCPKNTIQQLDTSSSCYELGTVHCCSGENLDKEKQSRNMAEAIAEHLKIEETIQTGIDSYLRKVSESPLKAEDRQMIKSIRNNFNSQLVGCDDKENCTEIFEDTVIKGSQDGSRLVSPDIFSLDGASKKEELVMEDSNSRQTNKSNDIFIVYAENPTTKDAYNEDSIHPFIVMPVLDRTSGEIPQNGSTEANVSSALFLEPTKIPYETNILKDNDGKTIESEIEEDEGELYKDGSEIDEVKTTGYFPASSKVVPPLDKKPDLISPFRAPPRHFKPQPANTERNKQSNANVLALLKEQSKGRVGLQHFKNNGEMIENTQNILVHDLNKAALLEEINIKTINNIMQTNFIKQATVLKNPNTVLKNEPILAQINSETEKSTEQVTKPSMGKSVHRFSQMGRFRLRNQSSIQPPSLSTTQVDVLNPGKAKSIRQQSLRRRTSNRQTNKSKVDSPKPEENSSMSGLIQKSRGSDESDIVQQSFTWERLQPRIKTTLNNPKSVSSSPTREHGQTRTRIPTTALYSRSRIRVNDSKLNKPLETQKESESLEISGSENKPQNSQPPAMFNLPEMEFGFQPMIRPRKLNIIGPIPVGFRENSRGFHSNVDNIGLEPPHVSSTPDFNSESQLNKNEVFAKSLVPPVYRYQDTPQSSSFSDQTEGSEIVTTHRPIITGTSFKSTETGKLLPPVVLPSFLQLSEEPTPTFRNIDLAGAKSTAQLETMINDQQGLTQLKQEFDTLTNKYEQILQRYSEVLSGYNERYRPQITSD